MGNGEGLSNKQAFRLASGEDDFWLVRKLLSDCWKLATPFFNWEVRRWDGLYFHDEVPGFSHARYGEQPVGLWETTLGGLIGAVFAEGSGDAWLAIHPEQRHMESEMLSWAEANLARPNKEGVTRLGVFCWEYDDLRRELLESRGYRKTESGDVYREKPYPDELPPPPQLPNGYKLHTLRPGNMEDCERYADLINAAFRRDFHKAGDIATFTTRSPSFRADLEMIAQAPDGSFAALAGMIYDEENRFGYFEPVCATPKPRPIGLTGMLMLEGWRRVRLLGAEDCYVQTGLGMAANRFYNACGFRVIHTGWMWKKEF